MRNPNPHTKTWIILGASSSVGRAFARQAAAKGANVILAGRDAADLARTAQDITARFDVTATSFPFDADDYETHETLINALKERQAPLGIFLLFGTMPEQSEIDADFDLAVQTINVNYLGAVSILSRLATRLETNGSGRIVVMSSVAGDRGRLKNYIYGSAKAGLNAYLQGLRARLCRANVSVTTVKAGFIDTDMTFGVPGLFLVATPDACAEACLTLAEKGRDVAYFPWFWRYIMLIIRHIPEKLFKQMSI
jgi:decaprenylphospho-beta-D-erythro-pentofuranosid-2-ulose 2-reductase